MIGRSASNSTIGCAESGICIAGAELPADVKRKPASTHGKLALDGVAFQQLLAAVYILQEYHDRLLETEPKADCPALSDSGRGRPADPADGATDARARGRSRATAGTGS